MGPTQRRIRPSGNDFPWHTDLPAAFNQHVSGYRMPMHAWNAPRHLPSVLLWHVHRAWTPAFVSGRYRYIIPVNPLRDEPIDPVVLQRTHEPESAERLLGAGSGATSCRST